MCSLHTILVPYRLYDVKIQTVYIITGNCAYGNDFESTLKSSAQIAHDILYLGRGLLWLSGCRGFEPRLV